MKKRAVVVCPGRGTYTKETLGYLKQANHMEGFLQKADGWRRDLNEPTITSLDSAEVFKPAIHTRGEHASSLIYACAYSDFCAIDRDQFEIVAVTGNSMGWYLTLAFGGALNEENGFRVVNTMGAMMREEIIGGQVIYPLVDENWRPSDSLRSSVDRVVNEIRSRPGFEVYDSIHLGGYVVLGANKPAITALLKELPAIENYPFQLINHAAFHTPLLESTSARAFQELSVDLFEKPRIPLIDGRGHIWQPYSTSVDELYEYTLGHQVVAPYDFTQAITVAMKEFAPEALILLGPGSSLGGSIGQTLVQLDWQGMKSKSDFADRQGRDPLLLAMGRADQRALVAAPGLPV